MLRIVFLKDLLAGRLEFPFGFELFLRDQNEAVDIGTLKKADHPMTLVNDVPAFFKLQYTNQDNNLSVSKIRTLEGYFVELANFESFDDYLERQISPNRRSGLRKYQRRLELCLDIHYSVYYGAIEREEYHRLFQFLEGFLTRRFAEKKEVNYEIPHLHEMEEIVYDLIKEKKASLFVIYHNKQPISIRINMFYQDLAFYIISGYDIDYSAFHIGTIDMLKNIEWCMLNRFKRYDLLKGYADYKKNWITHRYHNYDHLIYRPGNMPQLARKALLLAKLHFRYRSLELSKQFGLYNGLKKFKKFIYALRFGSNAKKYLWTTPANELTAHQEIRVFEDPGYRALLRPVYDYLYRHQERPEDIGVFTIKSQPDRFLVKGKKSSRILIMNKG